MAHNNEKWFRRASNSKKNWKQLCIELDKELIEKIKTIQDITGMPASEVGRRCIRMSIDALVRGARMFSNEMQKE